MTGVRAALGGREFSLSELETPLPIDRLIAGRGAWEVEIGFGKGRYLLHRAQEETGFGFLGIEVASEYYRRVRERMVKRGLDNLVLLRGEALYLLSAVLPARFASTVHVYFPDPWPKARHQNRRLLDSGTVDLVLDLLRPGGSLLFATDFLEYGAHVEGILRSHPGVSVTTDHGPWDGEPRTNYEAKYLREGRAITRLEVIRLSDVVSDMVHPDARVGLRAAPSACEQGGNDPGFGE